MPRLTRLQELIIGSDALHRLRRHAVLWAVIPLMIIIAGVAVYVYRAYRGAATELVIERDLQVAYLSAARLEDELAKFSADLRDLTRSSDMISDEPQLQIAALRTAGQRLSVFDGGVLLLDEFGTVRATQPRREGIVGQDWSDRPYFRQLLTGSSVVFADTESDGPGGTPTVVISVPVLGGNGELLGALAGMFRLEESMASPFYASIVRLRTGQSGNTYLVGSNGTILYDSSAEEWGASLDQRGLPDIKIGEQAGALRTRDPGGRDVVAAFAPVPGTPWTLVTEDDWDVLTASTRPYVRLFFMVVGFGMILPALGLAALTRQHSATLRDKDVVAQQGRMAKEMQRALLPQHPPMLPGWRVTAHVMPSSQGRCCYYDWLILVDGAVTLMVGDVSDKRTEAFAALATARASLRASARDGLAPASALARANDALCSDIPLAVHVTGVVAELDPESGTVIYANAGNAPPLHRRDDVLTPLDTPGPALGESLYSRYDHGTLDMVPGSILVLGNTGLHDARNANGERFGDARLPGIVVDGPVTTESLGETILAALQDFTGSGWEPTADVAVIVVQRVDGDPAAAENGGGRMAS